MGPLSFAAAGRCSSGPLAAAPNPLTLSRQPSSGPMMSDSPLQEPAFVLDLLNTSCSDSLQRFVVQDSSPAGSTVSAPTPRRASKAPRHSKKAPYSRSAPVRRAQQQSAARSKAGAAGTAVTQEPRLPPAQANMMLSAAPHARPAALGHLMAPSQPQRPLLQLSPFSGAAAAATEAAAGAAAGAGAWLTYGGTLPAAHSFADVGRLRPPATVSFTAAGCAASISDAEPLQGYPMAEAVQSPSRKRPAPLAVPSSSSNDGGSSSASSRSGLQPPALLHPAAFQGSSAAGTAGPVPHAGVGHWQLHQGVGGTAAVPTTTGLGQAMVAEQAWAPAALASTAPHGQSAALALPQHNAQGLYTSKGPQQGGLFTAFGSAAQAPPAPAAGCGGLLPSATAQLYSSFLPAGTAQWARHAQASSAASMRHRPAPGNVRHSPGAAGDAQGGLEPAFSSSVAGLTQLDSRKDAAAVEAAAMNDVTPGGWALQVRPYKRKENQNA
jgi:hypothetical protein